MNFALSVLGIHLLLLITLAGCGQQPPSSKLNFGKKALSQEQAKDRDNDGVTDSEDNCPRTPAGSKVFTKEDVASGKVSTKFVGCAANGDVMIPIGSDQNPPSQPIENPPSNTEPNQEKSISELTIGSKIKFRNEFVIEQKQTVFYLENLLPRNAYADNSDFEGYCLFTAEDEEIIGSKITPDSTWAVLRLMYKPLQILERYRNPRWGVKAADWSYVIIEIESIASKVKASIGCVSEDRGYSRREFLELDEFSMPVRRIFYVVDSSMWSKDITLDFFQRAVSVELAPKPEAPVIE